MSDEIKPGHYWARTLIGRFRGEVNIIHIKDIDGRLYRTCYGDIGYWPLHEGDYELLKPVPPLDDSRRTVEEVTTLRDDIKNWKLEKRTMSVRFISITILEWFLGVDAMKDILDARDKAGK